MRFRLASLAVFSVLLASLPTSTVAKRAPATAHPARTLVFELDSTLVRGIPKRYRDSYAKGEVIEAASSSGNRYFRVVPQARELISTLISEGDTVHIASSLPEDLTKSILDLVILKGGKKLGEAVKSVRSGTEHDLTTFASGKEPVIRLTGLEAPGTPAAQSNQVIRLGKESYFFESYTVAESARGQASQNVESFKNEEKFYPKTYEEWLGDHSKLSRLYVGLKESRALTTIDAQIAKINQVLNEPVARLANVGTSLLNGDYKDFNFEWTEATTDGKTWISGCKKIETRSGNLIGATRLEECLGIFKTTFVWKKKDSTWSVTGCLEVDAEKRRPIREATIDQCLSVYPVTAAWQEKLETVCSEYTQEGYYFVRDVPNARCAEIHRVIDANSKQPQMVHRAWLGLSIGALIPEIMSLANAAVVPKEVYTKYPLEQVAISLVQRLRKLIDGKQEGTPYFNFLDHSEITIAFDSRNLEAIRSGCFKNQHQTGSSNGSYTPTGRADEEDRFIRAKLESTYSSDRSSVVHQIRPKYSFLSLQDYKSGMATMRYSAGYGNTFALIRDEVKLRSTFTPSDSLGSHGTTLKTFFLIDTPPKGSSDNYWETQIWGPLCEKDIEAWLIDCPGGGDTDDATIAKLKNTGIPVYTCEKNTFGFWKKGTLLK